MIDIEKSVPNIITSTHYISTDIRLLAILLKQCFDVFCLFESVLLIT